MHVRTKRNTGIPATRRAGILPAHAYAGSLFDESGRMPELRNTDGNETFHHATAGHVDHGKSALVKALTGTNPDRLPEEQRRQITIDLGFAELDLGTANGERIHAGVVDVPGHNFVRNMIAGVGSIDLALFVVAADDGWMPQTEEHFQMLYLGVQRIIIALTNAI